MEVQPEAKMLWNWAHSSSCENYRKNTAKVIACEAGPPNQILLVSFTTESPIFLIALELINAGF